MLGCGRKPGWPLSSGALDELGVEFGRSMMFLVAVKVLQQYKLLCL